jgi:hypothetical protein
MLKPEKPYMVIDGDDTFSDFANPERRKQRMAKAEERAPLRLKPKKSQKSDAPTPAPSPDR